MRKLGLILLYSYLGHENGGSGRKSVDLLTAVSRIPPPYYVDCQKELRYGVMQVIIPPFL